MPQITHQKDYRDTRAELARFHQPVCLPYYELFELEEQEIIERKNPPENISNENQCHEFLVRGIHLMHFSYPTPGNDRVVFRSTAPFVSLVFSVNSEMSYFDEHGNLFTSIGKNEQQLLYIMDTQTDLSWTSGENAEILIINLTIDYFARFLSIGHPVSRLFNEGITEKISKVLVSKKLMITNRMRSVLYDIVQCGYQGEYKKLYVTSRLIELLMLQLEQAEQSQQSHDTPLIKNVNVEKMYYARDLIVANLSTSFSLVELAEQIGTNDCYLKKHFKMVFGTTVYGYLLKERMEKSRELLLNGNKKIADVAKLSGYKHTSHFSAAFKKYFGYLPNKIRI